MRTLLLLPIVHSSSDLGRLESPINRLKEDRAGLEKAQSIRQKIDLFWREVQSAIESESTDYSCMLLFQDALPVVPDGREDLLTKIVDELASHGSQNHKLLSLLQECGAELVGTESPELLVKEYQMVRKLIDESERIETSSENESAESRHAHAMQDLLLQRDQFIARRIDEMLKDSQTGILFIGMLHNVESFLPGDIEVKYPIGRPMQVAESSNSASQEGAHPLSAISSMD